MEATIEDLKALGHPVRWRILRLCLERSFTNKELSVELDLAPATTLRHVRALVKTNFLVPEAVCTGEHGALQRPYRATARSRGLIILPDDAGLAQQVDLAVIGAHRTELIAAGKDSGRGAKRGVLRLRPESVESLRNRIQDLIAEYTDEPDGEPLSYLWSLAARPQPDVSPRDNGPEPIDH
ncbi:MULTISPECIES: winged helix-turn-helix domain-containing protein [unclassified Kitasatospora]|uniref:winged helix-turn-helix domain-containing protein n=1 Tax=unclassified Kitasatospora TaxID=2633591 RepID=UPI0033F03773